MNVENWGWRSDPRPLPCLCAHKQGRGFFGSLFGPRCLCQNFATAAGALVLVAQYLAAPGSLLRGLCWNHLFRPFCACRPRSVMRGLCRNHRFRPFCTSPFSWIYSGFICLEGASRRSARAKQVSTNADLSGFMPDLCRIYPPKKRLPGKRHEKYGQINPTPR